MSKRKDKKRSLELYQSVLDIAASPYHEGLFPVLTPGPASGRGLTKMKKFRFHLLHQWMAEHIAPCRVADVGGGKGLLTYFLNRSGWRATVIDPIPQALPVQYKDILTGRQVGIAGDETVPRLNRSFEPGMARDFDLLVALHAHGCNIQIIDAAARFGRGFLVLPCCILDEPLQPPAGRHWLQCIADHAKTRGFALDPFRLNFKGQNIGLYARSAAP